MIEITALFTDIRLPEGAVVVSQRWAVFQGQSLPLQRLVVSFNYEARLVAIFYIKLEIGLEKGVETHTGHSC